MSLEIYNTLGRKKQIFKPIKKEEVGVYSCGPTVYWNQHIGNLRTYIFSDILKRVLIYNNYKVKHIINVTDVGHLTSDADSGEDKMEKAARKEGKSAKEISEFYFDLFKIDLGKLNILMPNKWAWATEHIKEQINLVKILEKKGYTYKTSDGIYFDTSKTDGYAKLAKLNIEGLQEGKRIQKGEKKNKTDFALWKFSNDEKRLQEWESPWGTGFPGWHIECSAMASKYLGKQFDIHTGGIDHIPIHHTNEIAQSECAHGKSPWVNYWMHGAFLELKDGKMAKSKGKILTISSLEEKGFSSFDYRYYCLLTHYRKRMIFSLEGLNSAKTSLKKIKEFCQSLEENKEAENKKYLKDFENAINDDLNMPKAVQVLLALIKDKDPSGKYSTIKKMDEVFGLNLLEKNSIEIPKKVKELLEKRKTAREKKDFKLSDELREEIKNLGFEVLDSKSGQEVKQI